MPTMESSAARTKRPARERTTLGPIRSQLDAVERTSSEAVRYVRDQLHRHPYATLGAGLAAGYVLGGGLTVRLAGSLLSLTGRVAMASLVSSVLRGVQPTNGRNDP